ncbi:hypothetical protein C5167_026729 [Papaver somniferum]|nr:hypothetical protein C5167_026729 [Papaver somniferum]
MEYAKEEVHQLSQLLEEQRHSYTSEHK